MYSLTLYTLIKVLNVFTKYCLGSADQGIHLKPCFSGESWRGILYHSDPVGQHEYSGCAE